jgi:hypothetical protein
LFMTMSVQLAYKKKRTEKNIKTLTYLVWKLCWQKTARFDVPYELSCLREGENYLYNKFPAMSLYNIFEMDRLDVKVMFVVSNKISMKFVQYFQWFPSNVKITE